MGFDHGAGHPLLFLDNAKAPNCQKNNGFNDLGHYSEWPKVAGTVIQAGMCSGSRFAAALSPREYPARAYPAPSTGSLPSSPPPAPAAAALPAQAARRRRLALLGAAGRYLNWGITLSEISRMVFITTSRGTDAVQLTSNIISSELKFSRRKWMRSTTSSGVPNRLASTAVSGLAEPASVLPMPALPA